MSKEEMTYQAIKEKNEQDWKMVKKEIRNVNRWFLYTTTAAGIGTGMAVSAIIQGYVAFGLILITVDLVVAFITKKVCDKTTIELADSYSAATFMQGMEYKKEKKTTKRKVMVK